MIHLVTAVSRPDNLPRIQKSIARSLARSNLTAKWILVVDADNKLSPAVEARLREGSTDIEKLVYHGGRCPYGIQQKNLGMGSIKDGYYHCIDDDNIVHPDFFVGVERAILANPGKRAFVFGQQRWDNVKSLVASPTKMEYGQIDNTMFVTHSSLIGDARYDLSRSGKEDFHFFRRLYDLNREDFVFLPETLAYYNFIYYFPAETKDELEALPLTQPREKVILPPVEPAPRVKVPGVLKIALYSSKRERCGIATYTSHLEAALASLGHDVRHWGSGDPYWLTLEEVRAWRPDVFHFQHETSIMPPEEESKKYAHLLSVDRTQILMTLHTEDERTLRTARMATSGRRGRVILHRPTTDAVDAVHLPMPCTVHGALPGKREMRKKYGIPEDAFVVSTVGFMIPWKSHPEIITHLMPWLEKRENVHLQVIASEHFNKELLSYAAACRRQIEELSAKLGQDRITHVGSYPSDLELIERLIASDLGYVWCPFDTGSSSAAAAQFTTARCPLVASDSSHYAFLGSGIVRGPKTDMPSFADLIQKTSEDVEFLKKLRANQWSMYMERNYIATALKHVELYREACK